MTLPADPFEFFGLRKFGRRLRSGEMTAEAVTRAYCARIQLRDPKIGAFKTIVAEQAIEAARGIDALLRAGTDLGPLMGVPVAVKEIFSIDGLPYGAGSELDLAEMTPPQGPFIDKVKRAGCVILGTTRTTEFAGATININKPMPWNPADEEVKRVCGGSSHGSAAALAAGLCAFSVGSDTGGSVRLPAALCGVFGFKPTAGAWPTQGVFALSPTLDSVGVFTPLGRRCRLIFRPSAIRAAEMKFRARARFGSAGRKPTFSMNSRSRSAAQSSWRSINCARRASRLSTSKSPTFNPPCRRSHSCCSPSLLRRSGRTAFRLGNQLSIRSCGTGFRQI